MEEHWLLITEDEAKEIATEAYIYFYPIVTMDIARKITTNLPPGEKPGFGPVNSFSNIREFPDASFRAVVRPNKEVRELAVPVNGWIYATEGIGTYGDEYTRRAAIAMAGLGANAIYPATFVDNKGNSLQGGKKYTLTFPKGQQPPVNAFWSLTLYDNEGFQVGNSINRYSIGSRDKLQTNKDGSLTLYIQSDSPGKDKESNWLPSAKSGNVNLILRLYSPKNEALTGKWIIPPVEVVD